MSPPVIQVARADDLRDVVHRAVQSLAEGKLVALPTETVYGVAASATHPEAVARLAARRAGADDSPLALAVKSVADAEDYAPDWGPVARRLARRCWPGPVTLVVEANRDEGLLRQLPDSVFRHVAPQGAVGLRCPANQLVQDVLRMLAGPIVIAGAGQPGRPDATNAQECIDAWGPQLDLVFDDGPARYGQPSSVVRLTAGGFDLLREGVVGRPTLERLARMLIVFVCTGNTCRSPLAEAMMRRHLADRLGVPPDELEGRGVAVASAGVAAAVGSPASPETVEVLRQRGITADAHSAQQLTEHLVRQADLLVAMTPSHLESIHSLWPDAAARVKLLDASGGAISDPIGGPLEVYQRCAEQIQRGVEHHAKAVLAELNAAPSK